MVGGDGDYFFEGGFGDHGAGGVVGAVEDEEFGGAGADEGCQG